MKFVAINQKELRPLEAMIGNSFTFNYPKEFTLLPEYTAHSGQTVTVRRKLTADEADVTYDDDGAIIDEMYEVIASDGWIGHAWNSELD